MSDVVQISRNDETFLSLLHEYSLFLNIVRLEDREKYLSFFDDELIKYYYGRRFFGLRSARGRNGRIGSFTTEDVDQYLKSLDSWTYTWKTYESRYKHRKEKIHSISESINNGSIPIVNLDYYEFILNKDKWPNSFIDLTKQPYSSVIFI